MITVFSLLHAIIKEIINKFRECPYNKINIRTHKVINIFIHILSNPLTWLQCRTDFTDSVHWPVLVILYSDGNYHCNVAIALLHGGYWTDLARFGNTFTLIPIAKNDKDNGRVPWLADFRNKLSIPNHFS